MNEILISDGPDLTRGEKACEGHMAHDFAEHPSIMAGPVEHPGAPPVATEKQRARRACSLCMFDVLFEELTQIFIRAVCITHVELNGLADPHPLGNGKSARILVRAQHVPNEKIAALKII